MGRKRQDRKSEGFRQKNKIGDSKVESNDSPEVPDRGEDIEHPRPAFGDSVKRIRIVVVLVT